MGKQVEVTTNGVNVRESPGLNDTKSAKVFQTREVIKGDAGEVVDGPVDADGHRWWKIRYTFDGSEGWSAEDYLNPESSPNPPENFSSCAEKAVNWAISWDRKNPGSRKYSGLCLNFVACAFEENESGNSGYAIPNRSAYAIDVAEDLRRFNQEMGGWVHAPKGALVFFNQKGDNEAGHIGIYYGNGTIIESYGTIKIGTDISGINRSDVGEYLGWSYPPEIWSQPPEIIYPGNCSRPGENIGNELTPTFKWVDVPNAARYAIYIRESPFEGKALGPLVFDSDRDGFLITGNIFTLPSSVKLENGKTYRWNMKSISKSGPGIRKGAVHSGVSNTLYFEINRNTSSVMDNATSNTTINAVSNITDNSTDKILSNNTAVIVNTTGNKSNSTMAGSSAIKTQVDNESNLSGIDVSDYQGYINWTRVAEAGYSFAFVKSSEGEGWTKDENAQEKNFAKNLQGASSAGLLVGAYHFGRPDLGNDPEDEARWFVNVSKDYLKEGYLRPSLDLEKGTGRLGKTALSNWTARWMATVENETGVKPVLYVSSDYAKNYLDGSLSEYDLWIAHWTYNLSRVPDTGIWNQWSFWQYSNNSSVPGIEGLVDLDVFNGNRSDISRFIISNNSVELSSNDTLNNIVVSVTNSIGQGLGSSEVFIDGNYSNSTDANGEIVVALKHGNHTIGASKAGYENKTWKGEINQTTSVIIRLENVYPLDVFVVSPIGPIDNASVYVDGRNRGLTDADGRLRIALTDGNHTIAANKTGINMGSWSGEFNHTSMSEVVLQYEAPKEYRFEVIVQDAAGYPREGASVEVDGINMGITGPKGDVKAELVDGNHTIEANLTGYGSGSWSGRLNHTVSNQVAVKINGSLEYPVEISAVNAAGYLIHGVEIRIDGIIRGNITDSGNLTVRLSDGNHNIWAIKQGYGSGNWTGVVNHTRMKDLMVWLNGSLEYPLRVTVTNAANYTVEDAEVKVDGVYRGKTDINGDVNGLMVADDRHIIEANLTGYGYGNWSGETNHTKMKGVVVALNGALEYPFSVIVENNASYLVEGAEIKIDGKYKGTTGSNGELRLLLSDGNHTIEANKTSYGSGSWSGNVDHGKKTKTGVVITLGGTYIKVIDIKPTDLCLVLDSSGSMEDTVGLSSTEKIELVKVAAQDTVSGINYPGSLDRVSIVSFRDYPETVLEFTNDFTEAKERTEYLYADGSTSFGAGLSQALKEFSVINSTGRVPAIIFMSDGMNNTPPDYRYYVNLCKLRGIRIYTVGYGYDADHDILKEMANETGGRYMFADPSKNVGDDIRNVFIQLQLEISGWNPKYITSGVIAPNETITIPFNVSSGSKGARIVLTYSGSYLNQTPTNSDPILRVQSSEPYSGSHLNLTLVDPDGNEVNSSDYNITYSEDERTISIIVKDPKPGNWYAKVKAYGDEVEGTMPITVIVAPEYKPLSAPTPFFNKTISIRETSGTNLTDYAVKIPFSPANFPEKSSDDGSDLTFFDGNGNELDYWVESWESNAKKGVVWVKMPILPANKETGLQVFFGSNDSYSRSNGSEVFDFFDDFEDGVIDADKWYTEMSSAGVEEKNGTAYIYSDKRSKSSADLISKRTFRPDVSIRFKANVSQGQNLDRKGMGILKKNVGDSQETIKEGVYWRAQDANLYIHSIFPAKDTSLLPSAFENFESKYPAGSRVWEIKWLDSSIQFSLDGKESKPRITKEPVEGMNARFSINTSIQAMPSEISLDWVLIRKCATTEPKVEIL